MPEILSILDRPHQSRYAAACPPRLQQQHPVVVQRPMGVLKEFGKGPFLRAPLRIFIVEPLYVIEKGDPLVIEMHSAYRQESSIQNQHCLP